MLSQASETTYFVCCSHSTTYSSELRASVLESPSHRAARTPAERRSMEGTSSPNPTMSAIPKHILDIWVIVLIILATILVMTSMVLCPAMAVIIYRVRTHPIRNGVV
ncbi:unnamed protein product [Caretta caretta]